MRLATPFLITASAGALALMLAMGGGVPAGDRDGLAQPSGTAAVETVAVQPGAFAYRLPGEYQAGNRAVDAPLHEIAFAESFEMMKYQVSAADYARCVADGACKPADGGRTAEDLPATGVDYQDAVDYAAWLSQRTGQHWRLPTDEEWAFAAAERFRDDTLDLKDEDGANPAARWIARYRKEAGNAAPDPQPKQRGTFGTNSKGLADMAGNVWDWTSTCYVRATVAEDGSLGQRLENCGVRVAGGKHRAYMSFFIRDGKSGGCAAGMAPHNLGIRLIRDRPSFLDRMKGLFAPSA